MDGVIPKPKLFNVKTAEQVFLYNKAVPIGNRIESIQHSMNGRYSESALTSNATWCLKQNKSKIKQIKSPFKVTRKKNFLGKISQKFDRKENSGFFNSQNSKQRPWASVQFREINAKAKRNTRTSTKWCDPSSFVV